MAGLPVETAGKIGDRPVYEFAVSSGDIKISDFNGGIVTVSIPYTLKKDEDPNAVLVYYIDSSNSLTPVRGSYYNGTEEFTTTHFSRFAIGYKMVGFTDVTTSDSCYAAVTYLGAREIITGTGFEPNRAVTRGEAIVMLMKAYDIKPLADPRDNFSDAKGEFAGYYAKAKEIGLTVGVGNNRISAETPLTREMLYTMVYNIKKYFGEFPVTAAPDIDNLTGSSSKFSSWSVNAAKKLVETGVLKPVDFNSISPDSSSTMSNFANVLYTVLNRQSLN